jgi:hypothetical protein
VLSSCFSSSSYSPFHVPSHITPPASPFRHILLLMFLLTLLLLLLLFRRIIFFLLLLLRYHIASQFGSGFLFSSYSPEPFSGLARTRIRTGRRGNTRMPRTGFESKISETGCVPLTNCGHQNQQR